MSFTFSDPYLRFAFWSAVASVVLTCLLTVQIVYLRLARLRRERRERDFLVIWHPLLLDALKMPTQALPKLLRSEHVFFLKLWNHLHETLRGDAEAGLKLIALRVNGYTIAYKMLRDSGRANQLLAILTLGNLRDRAAWHDLMSEAVFIDSTASLNALRSLVQIDAAAVVREMTPLLLSRDDWPSARIVAIFQENHLTYDAPLLKAAADGPLKQQLKALRLIEGLKLSLPMPTLAKLLAEDMPVELIVAALRVTLYPQLLSSVRTHLRHADWRVRVQAVKALGRIGQASDIDRLALLLDDKEWWVRYRAAQALVNLPTFNRAMFEKLLAGTTDRFAHDMLDQVLAEKEGA